LLDVISNTVISEVKTDGSKLEMRLIGKPQGLYLLLIRTTQGSFGTRIIKMNE
jgi:hypothetical protein